MKFLDLTLPTPAENLACDETLLDACEENGGEEILRFWESSEAFVVVGYANKVATEVNVAVCKASGIPVLRRCSGGGTVLQGPGCLNYALVLKIPEHNELRNITAANGFIMERNRAALESLLKQPVEVRGHTDLAMGGKKFSGNSQRRRKHFLLFHGTFLLNFDLALVEKFLVMPSKQPDYRKGRAHSEFVTNTNASPEAVKAALRQAWSATEATTEIPTNEVGRLVAEKYSVAEWNLRL